MTSLAFAQAHAHWAWAVLLIIFVPWLVYIYVSCRLLHADVLKSAGELSRLPQDSTNRIVRYIRNACLDSVTEQPEGTRTVHIIEKRLSDLLHDYVAGYFRKPRFLLTSLATGIALAVTFLLIGLVLQSGIHDAIQKGENGTPDLAQAVEALGSKFWVSVVGIVTAAISSALIAYQRRRIEEACEETADAAARSFTTRESVDLSVQRQQQKLLEQLVARSADTNERIELLAKKIDGQTAVVVQHAQHIASTLGESNARAASDTERHITQINEHAKCASEEAKRLLEQLAKLSSIEVSIKGLSTEVAHGLRQMVTQELVASLRTMLAETMAEALQNMTAGLSAQMRSMLEKELPQITGALESIRTSIEGQAAAPLERILEQLERVVSGGMKGESAQLSAVLQQFAAAIPALEEQLRSVLGVTSRQLSEQAERNSAASGAVIDHMAQVLTRLDEQRSGMAGAVEMFSSELRQQLTEFTKQLGAAGEGTVQRVLQVSGGVLAEQAARGAQTQDNLARRVEELAVSLSGQGEILKRHVESFSASTQSTFEAFATQLGTASDRAVRDVVGAASAQLDDQLARNERAMAVMTAQIANVVARVEAQGATLDGALRGTAEAMRGEVTGFSKSLADAGNDAIAAVMRETSGHVTQVMSEFRADIEHSLVSYRSLVDNMASYVCELEKSRSALVHVSGSVDTMASRMSTVLSGVEQGAAQMRAASGEMGRTAEALRGGTTKAEDVVVQATTAAQQQTILLQQQREYAAKVQEVFPRIFELYVKTYAEQAKQIESSWTTFFEKVERYNQSIGRELMEAAEELTSATKDLARSSEVRRTV